MKRATILFKALAGVILLLPHASQAQELFRTGRPVYARTPSQHAWDRPTVAARYADSIGRTNPSAYAYNQPIGSVRDNDYQRLQAARIAYMREADRYQRRYEVGFASTDLEDRYYRSNTDQFAARPPCRRERASQGDYTRDYDADLDRYAPRYDGVREPADFAPELRPRNTQRIDPYQTGPVTPTSTRYQSDRNYLDPTRTASISISSIFRSLLP